MAQLFPERANVIVRSVLVAAVVLAVLLPLTVWAFARTPAATGQYQSHRQPIPFAHNVHVRGLKIECRYCHSSVERAASAGLPPTSACVACHLDSMLQSPLFAPIRESLSTGRPIRWQRVTSVPDFVFFNHSAHVRNGVTCESCHGPVELMTEVYQVAPLTMEWCVGCHRAPQHYMRLQPAAVRGWQKGDIERGRLLVARYDIDRLTSCTTCHR